MRLAVFSDLHNEFKPVQLEETVADAVVLAGDIDTGIKGITWAIQTFPKTPVIYVAGNHEYYGYAIPQHTEKMAHAGQNSQVHFLQRQVFFLNGVRFLGCTLWSDFALTGNRLGSMAVARNQMNDYRLIRTSPNYRKLRPEDTLAIHTVSFDWLRKQVEQTKEPTVVITHHAPSLRSLEPQHHQDPLSGAFASELTDWIASSGILLWIHGHTHYNNDYRIGDTRILCNQKGYPDEPVAEFRSDFVAEI